jgi:hypothetical protein
LEGYGKTLGSQMDFTGKEGATSWCVKKWEEAGAIIIGKTSMHELGLGMVWPLFGICFPGDSVSVFKGVVWDVLVLLTSHFQMLQTTIQTSGPP